MIMCVSFPTALDLFLQHDLVLVPAAIHLLPSDQVYRMRYNPLHKPIINESYELDVRDVS